MCEVKVYFRNQEKEELIFQDVILVEKENDKIFLKNILGEKKEVQGIIKKLDMVEHKVILERK